jgi:hypothetical protein
VRSCTAGCTRRVRRHDGRPVAERAFIVDRTVPRRASRSRSCHRRPSERGGAGGPRLLEGTDWPNYGGKHGAGSVPQEEHPPERPVARERPSRTMHHHPVCNTTLPLLLLLLASCQTGPQVERFPTFDRAVSMADPTLPRQPKVFIHNGDEDYRSELVPYCWVRADRSGGPADGAIRSAMRTLIRAMPDAAVFQEEDAQVVGSVSQYWGWGVATSSPVYGIPGFLVGYREAPALLPFRFKRETGMVTLIRDPAKCVGMLEGDSLILVGDIDVSGGAGSEKQFSPLHAVRLSAMPGDKLRVVWIRPGQGRMEGTAELIANPHTYRQRPDGVELGLGEPRVSTDGKGRPCWEFSPPRSFGSDD